MEDAKERGARAAAAERAREYRAQAEAFRQLAALEPLEQKQRLLALSASKYDQVAEAEERVAYGQRRSSRAWMMEGLDAADTARP